MQACDRPNRASSAARRLSALVLAVAVLLATVFAGRTYSWCALAQQVCSADCATDGCDDTHEGEQGPVAHAPCCEARALDQLPPGGQHEAVPCVPAAPLAILPAASPPLLAVASLPHRARASSGHLVRRAPPRAGPRASAERCALLQVFRC